MKKLLLTILLSGCFDTAGQLDGDLYGCNHDDAQVATEGDSVDTVAIVDELEACNAIAKDDLGEIETLEAEKAAWLIEKEELLDRMAIKNYLIHKKALSDDMWIVEIDRHCDLEMDKP